MKTMTLSQVCQLAYTMVEQEGFRGTLWVRPHGWNERCAFNVMHRGMLGLLKKEFTMGTLCDVEAWR